jgi:hypothetical protein
MSNQTGSHEPLTSQNAALVLVSDYATLMVEILKDNARPEAGEVYTAMDMPWATLVGQIARAGQMARAYGK